MGKINSIKKQTDNRYVNLYNVKATSVHNTGLVEPDENYHEGAIRELYEETGLSLSPIQVPDAYQKPYFTTVGMTDESCATVYGYASGAISTKAQEDTEEIEVVLADRQEVKRILKEEKVAIMTAYMLMHFLKDEEPFAFLDEIK